MQLEGDLLRLTRIGEEATLANPLVVSLHVSGSAIRGTDYVRLELLAGADFGIGEDEFENPGDFDLIQQGEYVVVFPGGAQPVFAFGWELGGQGWDVPVLDQRDASIIGYGPGIAMFNSNSGALLPPPPGTPGTPGSPSGGSPSNSNAPALIFGTLVPLGAPAPAGYNPYAMLPVISQDNIGSGFGATFNLDADSLAFANEKGYTIRYNFLVKVTTRQTSFWGNVSYNTQQLCFTSSTNEVIFGEGDIPGYAAQDSVVSVTAFAEFVKNSQVFNASPAYQVIGKTPASLSLAQQFDALAAAIRDLFGQIGDKATALYNKLKSDPEAVLDALSDGVDMAFTDYFTNWQSNLVKPFFEWLNGGVSLGNLNFASLTSDGIVPFLLQYSGLTWDNIQNIALRELGEGNIAAVSRLAETIFKNLDMSKPESMMTFIQQFTDTTIANVDFASLKSQAISALQEKAGKALMDVVPQLLAKFVPGPGGLFAAYKAISNGLTWLMENRTQIQSLFDSLIAGVDHLINPSAEGVKNAILGVLNNSGGMLVSFAAKQLGLGKLPTQLKNALAFIPSQVEKAVRATVNKLKNGLNSIVNPVYNGRLSDIKTFSYRGKTYVLFAARDSQGVKVKIVVQDGVRHTLIKVLEAKDFATTEATAHLADYLAKAKALADGAKGKPRGKTASAAEANYMANLKTKQEQMVAAETLLVQDI